ncbi:Kae1-associated serine/threonine protein kinase [Candidatus Micrarchaeota archaeon]|nr:Kae1-associated serine/threonine protein kinase [Candidatus Micrarchaeota archaeon]
MRGAEAVVTRGVFLKRQCVVKNRIAKKYRIKEIDSALRTSRTKVEARLLHRAKMAGVKCPIVLKVDDFSITMTYINGKRPKMNAGESEEAGKMLGLLHNAGIIHGDYTPANILKSGNALFVIDFGLGYFSHHIEDMAVDVYTMLRALDGKVQKQFLSGYESYKNHGAVFARVEQISKRVRYA